MPTIPVLDLRPGDQVPYRGGWFTLAALPLVRRRGGRLQLRFVGGATRTVGWLDHITTKGDS